MDKLGAVDESINPEGLTQDQIQQLMDAGVAPDKIALLQGRMKKEKGINSQGYMVSGHYIAPNPLQIGLEAYQGYQDRKSNKDLEGQQDTLMQSIPNARAVYAGAMDDPNMQAKIAAVLRSQIEQYAGNPVTSWSM